MTLLIFEQNANVTLNASAYGYILETGRIVMEGDCADLRERTAVKEFHLGRKEAGVRDAVPDLRRIAVIGMKGLAGLDDRQVIALDALREAGRARRAARPHRVAEAVARPGGDDTAIRVYTSGTTGPPKGKLPSHANLIASCVAFEAFLPRMRGGDRLNCLPLCHMAERVSGEYAAIRTGAVTNFVENPETVPADLLRWFPRWPSTSPSFGA